VVRLNKRIAETTEQKFDLETGSQRRTAAVGGFAVWHLYHCLGGK